MRAQVSVGVAVVCPSQFEVSPDELVRDADIALYRAKALGRNRFEVFDNSMHDLVRARYNLEADLRGALEREEFTVHYQPIVSLHENHVVGFEALLRWDRPNHGAVEPQQFVPVLEELDLIVDVGQFVLQRALKQLAVWSEEGSNVYVSINVAARQIHSGGLVASVADLLVKHSVPSHRLLLELTESLLIEDSPAVRGTMSGLTQLGVRLAIDDFGTGHSSLQYLTRFPISALKVDRSFVQALGVDPDAATIVQAVVGMSHALGMTVIAEGVETVQQRSHVARLGCDAVQGYTEGRPDAPMIFSLSATEGRSVWS
jgi:EAL domain-containing protein (putative c-di-GMP-specific phosphodiesterase class I)